MQHNSLKLAWILFKQYHQIYISFNDCLKLSHAFNRNEIDEQQAKLAKTWLVQQSFSKQHSFHEWNKSTLKKSDQFISTFTAFTDQTWINADTAIKAVKLWKLYRSKINPMNQAKYYSELMDNKGEPIKRLVFLHFDSKLSKKLTIYQMKRLFCTSPTEQHFSYNNHPNGPTTTYQQNKGKHFALYRDGKTTAVINNHAHIVTDQGLKSSFSTDSKYVQEHKNPTRVIKKNSSAIRSANNTARKKAIEEEASNNLQDANPSSLHQPTGQTRDIEPNQENLGHRQGVEDYNGKPQVSEQPEQLALFPDLYSNTRGDLIASDENIA